MKLCDINIRDPFILPYEGKYYLYGTRVRKPEPPKENEKWFEGNYWGDQSGFDVYISEDLQEWSAPKAVFEKQEGFWGTHHFWAPEVHAYNEKFYMLATFNAHNRCRGTHILVSDRPDGCFVPVSKDPVTPRDWECLDGTLYVDKQGIPHVVFCHEWTQIKNGAVCEVTLSQDLTKVLTEPRVLWHAADHPGVAEAGKTRAGYVTDGPFLYRCENGELLSIWSSFTDGGYAELIAKSDNGDISGNWSVQEAPLWSEDGGHGMIFRTFSGEKLFTMHRPNEPAQAERPVIVRLFEKDGKLTVL